MQNTMRIIASGRFDENELVCYPAEVNQKFDVSICVSVFEVERKINFLYRQIYIFF